jgi:hypothetical protein
MILKEIDAWKHIEARTQPYHNMQIWVSSVLRLIDLIIVIALELWCCCNQASSNHALLPLSVKESNGPGVVRFAAKELDEPELGRIAEDCTIQVQ